VINALPYVSGIYTKSQAIKNRLWFLPQAVLVFSRNNYFAKATG
jgi:hypothetical protein